MTSTCCEGCLSGWRAYSVLDVWISTVSHQSHDCVKMTSFTGKHESCEPSALRSDIYTPHRPCHRARKHSIHTDCCRFGLACELSNSSAISEFPSSQHSIKADNPPCGVTIIVYTSIKLMKGDRDGKMSATRNCLYSAVVVNVHYYASLSPPLFLILLGQKL